MPTEFETAAFETALTDEAYAAAWRMCRRLARSPQDAEDLLQDGLTHAFTRFDQLRDQARFKGWLLSIIRTRHLDGLRRERSRPQATVELPDLADASATEPLGLDTAAALARLPQSQQELLSLFYIDGLNLSETGQVLGIRPQVVRQRLYRARQALRRQLESTPATQRARRPAGGDCHETR